MNFNRMEADAYVANAASIRVPEKVGCKGEGLQNEQYCEASGLHDLALFALPRKDDLR